MPREKTLRRRQLADLKRTGQYLFDFGLILDEKDPLDLSLDDLHTDLNEESEIFMTTGRTLLGIGIQNPFWGKCSLRGPYFQFPKSTDFFTTSIQWPDRWFRGMYRVGRPMFDRLVSILEEDPIFHSTGRKPQAPVKIQLGCFLSRYGMRGSDHLATAQRMSLGFGSVSHYCDRVTRAFRNLRNRYIAWPHNPRKDTISQAIQVRSGFVGCVGAGDGTLFRLTTSPIMFGGLFHCRKKMLAINAQATTDHKKRFTSFDIGWPGSVTDVTIFKNSYLWIHRRDHFREGEYILVDKGYPSSPYTVRPFSEPEVRAVSRPEQKRMRKFNALLSSVRIDVEHIFGLLKGRFQSLKEMGTHRDIQDTYRTIEALMVIHNMCIDFGDRPEDIEDFDPTDDFTCLTPDDMEEVEVYGTRVEGITLNHAYETDAWLRQAGHAKRAQLFAALIPE